MSDDLHPLRLTPEQLAKLSERKAVPGSPIIVDYNPVDADWLGAYPDHKSLTFDKAGQDALPEHIKAKMKADREASRAAMPERFEPHSKGINALRDFIVRKTGELRRAKRHTCNTDGRVYELTDGATRTFLSDDAALAWYGHNWERVRSCSVLCTICEEAGGHL